MLIKRSDTLRHLFLQDTEPSSQSAQNPSARVSQEAVIHPSLVTKQRLKEMPQKGETKHNSTDEEKPIALQMPDDTTTNTNIDTPFSLPSANTTMHTKTKTE